MKRHSASEQNDKTETVPKPCNPGSYRFDKDRLVRYQSLSRVTDEELSGLNFSRNTIKSVLSCGCAHESTLRTFAKELGVSFEDLLDDASREAYYDRVGYIAKKADASLDPSVLVEDGKHAMTSRSFAHARVAEIGRRLKSMADELNVSIAEANQILWQFYITSGRYHSAEAIARIMRRTRSTPSEKAFAARALGECHFYTGKHVRAVALLCSSSIRRLDGGLIDRLGSPLDTRVAAYGHACLSLAAIGRTPEAMKVSTKAIEQSRVARSDPSRVFALHCAAVLRVFLRDPDGAAGYADEEIVTARDAHIPAFVALGRIIRLWADAMRGHPKRLDELFEEFVAYRETPMRVSLPFWRSLVAEAAHKWGETYLARLQVRDAETEVERIKDTFYAPCTQLLYGDVLLEGFDDEVAAATHYRKGAKIARDQGASLFELRCLLRLLRLARDAKDRKRIKADMKRSLDDIKGAPPERAEAREVCRPIPRNPE